MNALHLMLLLGCSNQQDDSAESKGTAASESVSLYDFEFEDRLMLTEELGDCEDARKVDDYLHLCVTEQGTYLVDERDDTEVLLGTFATHAAVRTAEGDIVLALDGAIYTHADGVLRALTTPIPVPITHMERSEDTLWLWGGGRLFRWLDEEISEVSLPDYPNIDGFAAVGQRLFLRVPWLVETIMVDGSPAVVSVEEMKVTAMAGDQDENLWLVSDGMLYLKRPAEPLRGIVLPRTVTDVHGPAIWIGTEEQTYRYRDGILSAHAVPAEGTLSVDGYGRLLQLRDGELHRHSIDRPVVVTGLPDSLMVQETALLLPSDPESLTDLHVWLDDEPLEVMINPWSVVIDPERLQQGDYTLRFFCESDLGDRQDEYSVWVGELPDVTWSEIKALSEDRCLGCHSGATLTDLSTKADWKRQIDAVIYQVSINSMPQGGPYLSEEQIAMIRGWKQGGFQ